VREGATLVVNCKWSFEQLEAYFPSDLKKKIAEKRVRLLTVDATAASEGAGCTPEMLLAALFWPLGLGPTAEIPDGLRYAVKGDLKTLAKTASVLEYPTADWAAAPTDRSGASKRVFGPLRAARKVMDTGAIDQYV
jgi:hypothetical protein